MTTTLTSVLSNVFVRARKWEAVAEWSAFGRGELEDLPLLGVDQVRVPPESANFSSYRRVAKDYSCPDLHSIFISATSGKRSTEGQHGPSKSYNTAFTVSKLSLRH